MSTVSIPSQTVESDEVSGRKGLIDQSPPVELEFKVPTRSTTGIIETFVTSNRVASSPVEKILLAIGSKALPTLVENAASEKIAIARGAVQPEWRENVGTSVIPGTVSQKLKCNQVDSRVEEEETP